MPTKNICQAILHFIKKMNFVVKWNKFQPIAMMQPWCTNYSECQKMSLSLRHGQPRTGSNVQELGVCCPIPSAHTIRTLPCTNWHGKIFQTIFRTQEIHRKCKTQRNESSRKTKLCNSATKLAVIVCNNRQWRQDINAMEDTMMVANAIQHT